MTDQRSAGSVPVLAAGATFLAMLDTTVTNLAVPDLHRDFPSASVSGLTWVITLYAVMFAALLAPAGRLADTVGRRTLFQAGVGLFTVASLAVALSPTLPAVLATRGLQGAAAAAMIPASLALLLHETTPQRRAGAIGLWSASGALAAAIGPSVGGVLVDASGWRVLFLINVPVGVAMVAAAARLPRTTVRRGRLPDWLGTLLLGGGVGALALGVTQSQDWSWGDPRTLGMLAAGAVMLGLALWRSARHPVPAVEISLWRSRTFAVANLASALYGAALYPWMLLGVLFITQKWGYSILEAGFAVTPGAVTATAGAVVMGRLTGRLGVRPVVVTGALVMAAGGAWTVAFLPADPAFLTFWLPVGAFVGAGMGMVTTGTSTAAAMSVDPMRFAGATGLNTTARQLGGALGIAVLAALLPTNATMGDFRAVYVYCTITSLAAACAGLWLTIRPPRPAAEPAASPGLPAEEPVA